MRTGKEGMHMKVNIIAKNFKTYPKLQDKVEMKFEKLSKYFADEIVANVVLSHERGKDKLEATINAKGAVFRAEEVADDIYESLDLAISKLSKQMSKFKGKLQKRYMDNKALKFEFLPEPDEPEEEASVVRKKKLELRPMNTEEAILEMGAFRLFLCRSCPYLSLRSQLFRYNLCRTVDGPRHISPGIAASRKHRREIGYIFNFTSAC